MIYMQIGSYFKKYASLAPFLAYNNMQIVQQNVHFIMHIKERYRIFSMILLLFYNSDFNVFYQNNGNIFKVILDTLDVNFDNFLIVCK